MKNPQTPLTALFATLFATLFAVLFALGAAAPSNAQDDMLPDAVMVMPLEDHDISLKDREILDGVGASPGDVLPIETKVYQGSGRTVSLNVFAGTDYPVPLDSALIVPAGAGSTEPVYTQLLAWDDDDHSEIPVDEQPDERTWLGEPENSAFGWEPDGLVWASSQTYETSDFFSTTTWRRVAFGVREVWVDERRLIAPEDSPVVREIRETNIADAEAQAEAEAAEQAEQAEVDANEQVEMEAAEQAEQAQTDEGTSAVFKLGVVVALLAGGVFLWRRRANRGGA